MTEISDDRSPTEVVVDRWTSFDGSVDYMWSVWRGSERLHHGEAQSSADTAEAEARDYCRRVLGFEPDRITRL